VQTCTQGALILLELLDSLFSNEPAAYGAANHKNR
jgi:hypothetical protein